MVHFGLGNPILEVMMRIFLKNASIVSSPGHQLKKLITTVMGFLSLGFQRMIETLFEATKAE